METGKRIKDIRGLNSTNVVQDSHTNISRYLFSLGSMVQKGKFSAAAWLLVRTLKKVDFPTFGIPTIPIFKLVPTRPISGFRSGSSGFFGAMLDIRDKTYVASISKFYVLCRTDVERVPRARRGTEHNRLNGRARETANSSVAS